MAEKKKMPEIRFASFSDDWADMAIGQIMVVTSVKRIHQSDWTDNGVRFIRARDIVSAYKGEEVSDYLYISQNKYDEYSMLSGKVKIGDLLVTGVGSIGVPMLIENEDPLYFKDGNVIWFKNNDLEGKFFYYAFTADSIQKYIRDSAGIGTVGTYTIDSGKKTPIQFPSKKEQTIIGELFKNLDNLIALQQRKYDKTVNMKKACLEKMFPKKDAKVPEVRFAGFGGEWVEKKLCDIVTRLYRKNSNLASTLPLTISAQFGLVDQITFFNNQVASRDVSGYYLLRRGEFAYNKSYSTGFPWGAVKRLDRYDVGVLSTLYIVFEASEVDSDFLVTFFGTTNWHSEVAIRAAEGARNHGLLNISADDFFEILLSIPENKKEQAQIGAYFKQLDTLISLYSQELEKLKNIKKACLAKMFI